MFGSTSDLGSNPRRWDDLLPRLFGHPLQSRLWGDALSHHTHGRESLYLHDTREAGPDWIARVEERRLFGVGKVAWIPRGPVFQSVEELEAALDELCDVLGQRGFCLMAMSPWFELKSSDDLEHLRRTGAVVSAGRHRTIWLDLTQGHDALWQRLNAQFRSRVGYARRAGVTVDAGTDEETVTAFFDLCQRVSEVKGFRLAASPAQMLGMLRQDENVSVEARLFVARFQGALGAGLFALRSGTSVHYIWGGADRAFSRQRVAEAVQWAVIEWALSKDCRVYDLEGIDPVRNPGTYQFKKKMGGREVELPGEIFVPLNLRGRVLAMALRWRG